MKMKNGKKEQGFTLIELLVVIAIIGLLASVVLVALNGARLKSRDTKRQADLAQIVKALELYYSDNNAYVATTYFSSWDGASVCGTGAGGANLTFCNALVPKYMSLVPKDPVNIEGGAANYIGDAPPTDEMYMYYSYNGQSYILGTNLEKSGAPSGAAIGVALSGSTVTCARMGNYQISSSNITGFVCP